MKSWKRPVCSISALVVLVLIGLATSRQSCPLFFGAYGKTMLSYPTPGFDVKYDSPSQRLEIEVTTVYDPTAALVIGFQPFSTTRRSLADTNKCENRNSDSVEDWTWEMGDYSMCEEGGGEGGKPCGTEGYSCALNDAYPPSANGWLRTYKDCNTVTYKYTSSLEEFLDNCGSSFTGVREVRGKVEHYGSVFVAYVRPATQYDKKCDVVNNFGSLDTTCSSGYVYNEQQITFYIDNSIKLSISDTCTDSSNDLSTSASIQWTNNTIELNAKTLMPRPTDKGLLCSMTSAYQGPTHLEVRNSKKDCACDIHCYTSAYCIGSSVEGKCEQSWTVQASGKFYPGMLDKGMYKLTWDVNDCTGYTAGMESCPSSPKTTCSSVITVSEEITVFFEYAEPIRPFGALLLKQPPNSKFTYMFTDDNLKVWIRVTPLANGLLNTSSLEYCEAEAGQSSLTCKGQWTKLQSWDSNAKQMKGVVDGNITISAPRDKVFLFKVVSDSNTQNSTTLVLDTHNLTEARLAPIPSTYINVDRTTCGTGGTDIPGGDDVVDGFLSLVLSPKTLGLMLLTLVGLVVFV